MQVFSFLVGGYIKTGPKQGSTSPLPAWDYFLADEPHSLATEPSHQKGPMQQIADTEYLAAKGTVVGSPEVGRILQGRLELLVLDEQGCVQLGVFTKVSAGSCVL